MQLDESIFNGGMAKHHYADEVEHRIALKQMAFILYDMNGDN